MDQVNVQALRAERAQLVAANDAAPCWGAAVGARAERIWAIDKVLATASPTPGALADLPAEDVKPDRAEFEKWISGYGFPSRFSHRGCYENSHTVMAWNAWQASLKYTLLASSPAASAPPVDGGDRDLQVTRGTDGRIVLSSLGGGMPVAIRMTETEAAQVVDAILAHLRPAAGAAGLVKIAADLVKAEDAEAYAKSARDNHVNQFNSDLAARSLDEADIKASLAEGRELQEIVMAALCRRQQAEAVAMEAIRALARHATPQGAGETAGGVVGIEGLCIRSPAPNAAAPSVPNGNYRVMTTAAKATAAPEQAGSREWELSGSISSLRDLPSEEQLRAILVRRSETLISELDVHPEGRGHRARRLSMLQEAGRLSDAAKALWQPAAWPHSDAEGRS